MLHKSKKLEAAVQKHGYGSYGNASFGIELSGAIKPEDALELLNTANEAGKKGLNLYWCEYQETVLFFAATNLEAAIQKAGGQ